MTKVVIAAGVVIGVAIEPVTHADVRPSTRIELAVLRPRARGPARTRDVGDGTRRIRDVARGDCRPGHAAAPQRGVR